MEDAQGICTEESCTHKLLPITDDVHCQVQMSEN